MQEQLGAYIAIRAINEFANSALPNAPVRPDPPKRRRVLRAIVRLFVGTRASIPAGRTVGRTPGVRRAADNPEPGDWPGRLWQTPPARPADPHPTQPTTTTETTLD